MAFTVAIQHVWIVNGPGSLSSLDDAGNVLNDTPTAGGGVGIAIDGAGSIWSVNVGGGSLAKFDNTGASVGSYTGGGLSGATALAIDGSGYIWVTGWGWECE